MSGTVLTGLRGSQPLGFLASLGVLLALSNKNSDWRLGWLRQHDWLPTITLNEQIASMDEIYDLLHEFAKKRSVALETSWQDVIKADVARYRQFALDARELAQHGDPLAAEFAAAFASELVLMKTKPEVKPTPLDNTAGQQKFLGAIRGIGQSLGAMNVDTAQGAFQEALLGSWRFADDVHSLGWDPAAERLHAYGAQSPTKDPAKGVLAAVWLAAMGVAMFPVALECGRFSAAGFDTRNEHFSWPIWEPPIDVQTVRSLLTRQEWAGNSVDAFSLRHMGVAVVFRSRRVVSDKGYGQQRAAETLL